MSQFIEMFSSSAERVELFSLCDTFIDGDWIEAKDQSDSGIRLIQTGNVGIGKFKDKDDKARFISEETFNRLNCTEVIEGDILISRLPDPVGRACIIPTGLGKSITAVDCTIIRLNGNMLPKFFVAFTNTPDYAMQIKKVLSGTTRLRVSRVNLGKIQIPVPSIEEQRHFVSIAEQADKSEFDGFKSQFIEMFASNDYELLPLGDLCDKISDGSHNPPKGIDNSDYLMISSKNVFKDNLDLSDVRYLTEEDYKEENKRTKISPNDVLLTIVGTIGRTYLVKGDEGNFVMQRSVAVLTPNSKVTPTFLMFYLHTDKDLEKEGRGNAQKGIYLKQLSQYKIKVPPIYAQKQFESIYRQADKSENHVGYRLCKKWAKV